MESLTASGPVATVSPTEKPAASRSKQRRAYQKSGLHGARRALQTFGKRAIPARSALGRALAEWRAALVADLGGEGTISTQQTVLVDACVTTKFFIDSLDGYLLTLPALVDKRHRRVWPVVKDRQALVGQLASLLRDLGLQRRVPDDDVAASIARMHVREAGEKASHPSQVSKARDSQGEEGEGARCHQASPASPKVSS